MSAQYEHVIVLPDGQAITHRAQARCSYAVLYQCEHTVVPLGRTAWSVWALRVTRRGADAGLSELRRAIMDGMLTGPAGQDPQWWDFKPTTTNRVYSRLLQEGAEDW